jgi:Protein of unknown function (DUF3500)
MADNRVQSALADSMAVAATAFLDSLDERQRALAQWGFPADEERQLWFYTPTDHGGLPLNAMSPTQQQLAFKLVATGLSRAAYVTVSTIIGLENVLDELEGWTASWGRERGRDSGLYYLRIFGDPLSEAADGKSWSWRFGGHHVSINHTIVNGAVAAVTPCFLGADPASSPLLGTHPLRPLAGAEDLGRELVLSLTDAQRAIAVVSPIAPVDLVGANRSLLEEGALPQPLADIWRGHFTGVLGERVITMQDGLERAVGTQPQHNEAVRYSSAAKGLVASALTTPQQQILRALLDVYLRRMPDALAEIEVAKFAGDHLNPLTFLWAGSFEPGVAHYYRIQGPRLVVEYDNAARTANHVHTVWRDPEGDFGRDTLADHYRTHHE